jgi:hypothetical protein
VQTTPCLREQRGRIMRRNSCRSPWVHTTNMSVRQALMTRGGRTLSFQVEVFNFFNLVNSRWGQYRIPNTALLTHVGQTGGSVAQSQAIFRFDPSMRRYQSENTESNYQLQLAARYSF